MMVASSIIAVTGATFSMPILNTIASLRTPQNLRGRMLGTTSSFASWGRVVGPLLAGINLQLFGYSVAWFVAALIGGLFLTWALSQRGLKVDRTQE